MPNKQISRSRILITGGSRGIGFEVARDQLKRGNLVWICGTAKSVFEARKNLGSDAVMASLLDLRSQDSVREIFQAVHNAWGGIDAVIHSGAVLGQTGPFWELDSARFLDLLQVNVLGTFHVCKEFTRQWISHPASGRRGKLVLFSGGGAAYGYPNFLPYGTSKAAAVRLCETISMELAAQAVPIDVNIIAPGANETEMLKQVRAAGGEVRTTVPFSKPIALCNWLVSEASDHVTGRFIHVNDEYSTLDLKGDLKAASRDLFTLRRVDK